MTSIKHTEDRTDHRGRMLSHGRRKFFVLADIIKTAEAWSQKKNAAWSPLAHEAVRRIDLIFDAERAQRTWRRHTLGAAPDPCCPVGDRVRELDAPRAAKFSRHNDIAKAMDYMLKRWDAFTRFLDDGRICLTNNAAERALRCVALGRRNWTFCGSDQGGERQRRSTRSRAAKLNDIDPEAWLADVLRRINDHPPRSRRTLAVALAPARASDAAAA